MLTLLKIRDETIASIGKAEQTFTVAVTGETITVRDLIYHRVTQEVEQVNQKRPEYFRMLVQPSEAERTLNGYKLTRPRAIDAQAQYKKALEAFEGNGFVILVGDHQAESLDEKIVLQPETSITFLKLVPLVGG